MTFSPSDISRTLAAQFGGCQDFSTTDDTTLHTAAFEGDVDVLRQTLKLDKSRKLINQRNHLGCTPLRLAATGGHADCASLLLDHGASIDLADVKGQTPLHVAVKNKHEKCAEVLLEMGANPDGDAHNRTTPLCLAAMQGSLQLVELLLRYNAATELQRKGSSGINFSVNPLQLAMAYQNMDCLKSLLIAGGKPATTSPFTGDSSPFHMVQCTRQLTQLLHEFGITLWIKDGRGRYPWEMEASSVQQDPETHQDLMKFFQKIRDEPRSLKSFCRLSVWRHMLSLKRNVAALKYLTHVPQSLIQYLTFENL